MVIISLIEFLRFNKLFSLFWLSFKITSADALLYHLVILRHDFQNIGPE
jgi:hypothetical protein